MFRISSNHHALGHLFSTGSDHAGPSLDLDKAEAAAGVRPNIANGTKVGDIDTRIQGGEKDFFALLRLHLLAVNC
jgi:hypothetical protein